jgi:pilus assembly protein CpaC
MKKLTELAKVPLALLVAAAWAASSSAQTAGPSAGPRSAVKPCTTVTVDPPTTLALGKSQVVQLPFAVSRVIVGGRGTSATPPAPASNAPAGAAAAAARPMPPAQASAQNTGDGVADTEVTLLGPTELFFLARRTGTMNVVLQSADGRCLVKDMVVTIDPVAIQAKLFEVMPSEKVNVRAAENAIILTGTVTDSVALDQVVTLASAYGDGKRVVNFLRVGSAQQVMLEVKIAEVSKTLLNRLGLDFTRMIASSGVASVISGIVGGGPGFLARYGTDVLTGIGGGGSATVGNSQAAGNAFIGGIDRTQVQNPDGTFSNKYTISPGTISRNATLLNIDAQKKDGILRILAEPNIMAISGQQASFLSGGKIFIPVAQNNALTGGSTITLQEKEFGVGLKFTPTVLDGTRISLKLVSEVSDLVQTGSPFTAINGVTAVLPSMTTRRVDTTVQLQDGQSFAVAGLIKNNLSGALDKFPGLGEAPVLGALFRSTEFQTDQTELMFLITPRLVKPMAGPVVLPTDNHVPPTANDATLRGVSEGTGPEALPAK